MYLTEKEIMMQHEALRSTYDYMIGRKEEIMEFLQENSQRKFNFIGCGSSFMLSKSGQKLFGASKNSTANAIAGGDYLVNPDYYQEMINDSIVVSLSRSGKTSEIVRGIEQMKERTNCKVISFSMQDENDIMPFSDLDFTMDWCYDRSVCQTRTVTNLYLAMTMLYAFYQQDTELLNILEKTVSGNESFKEIIRPLLKTVAAKDWENVVVLADGPVAGLAEEGALAFTEICMISGCFFHMLDYRHGPMVLNNEKTLTIMLLQSCEEVLQANMVEDMKKRKGTIVTVSDQTENPYGVDLHISLNGLQNQIAAGIPFVNIMQILAYEKAIVRGTNPDQPTGLDAYITLKM